jgi:hypothetical protein
MITALVGIALLLSLKFDKSRVSTVLLAGAFVFGLDENLKEYSSQDVHYIQGCFKGFYTTPGGKESLVAETKDGEIRFRFNSFASFRAAHAEEGDCGTVGYFKYFGTHYLMSFTGGSGPGDDTDPD